MDNYSFISTALKGMKIDRPIMKASGAGIPLGNWRIGIMLVKQTPDYGKPSLMSRIKTKLTMRSGKPGRGESRPL